MAAHGGLGFVNGHVISFIVGWAGQLRKSVYRAVVIFKVTRIAPFSVLTSASFSGKGEGPNRGSTPLSTGITNDNVQIISAKYQTMTVSAAANRLLDVNTSLENHLHQ